MASVVKSIGIIGLEGYLIDVEVSVYGGVAMTSIVGLGDKAVKESSDRIETCLTQMDLTYPKKKIVINLSPSEVKKSGTYFELAMLIGILLESEQIVPVDIKMEEYIFLGEISLNGELKSFQGVLPMVIAARNKGLKKIILPTSCLKEASLVNDMELFPFDTLKQVMNFIENKTSRKPNTTKFEAVGKKEHKLDFTDVYGHKDVLEYVVAAAAGNHNLLLIGAPGCGKSMIAKRIPTILPEMTEEEILEITSIYSICGLLKENKLIIDRPFRAPHYNASSNALIGGGINAMPGEISMAHNGVLFLDEFPEFSRSTLEALRQPLEDRTVTISRVKQTNIFPANFQLVAAMNPCPCGNYGTGDCACTPYEIKRYTQRISGPILDRIDIQKYMGKVDLFQKDSNYKNSSSEELKEIVEIARTFADMDQSKEIQKKHMIYGLMARDLDKDKKTLLV
jgi:magnesium chelatase family protein